MDRRADRPSAARKRHIDRTLAHARSKVALLVNRRQAANPVLRYVKHVRVELHSGVDAADFLCGTGTVALYLSLQYHRLHPTYIYTRVRALPPAGTGGAPPLRVLLVLCDVADHGDPMGELSTLALLNKLTILVASSLAEAARYLETLRSYDAKGADDIQERVGDDYASRLNAALSSIRGVNRTDVSTLAFTFGALRNVALASKHDLRKCPGLGERKVDRLYKAMHQPFKVDAEWTDQDVRLDEDGDDGAAELQSEDENDDGDDDDGDDDDGDDDDDGVSVSSGRVDDGGSQAKKTRT